MTAQDSILILTIETATRAGSVCLARGHSIIAARTGDANVSQSAHLLPQIEEVLAEAKASMRDVELFAAAAGPGSFTGLRIGLATIKAFASTLGRPCVGIRTLEAIAHAAGYSKCTIAMLPAGRGEVFWQMFETSENLTVRALSNAGHIKPQDLIEKFADSGALVWAGDGARLYVEQIGERARLEKLLLLDDEEERMKIETGESFADKENVWRLAAPVLNLAEHVSALARERYHRGDQGDAKNLQAIYVRLSDAEIKQQCPA